MYLPSSQNTAAGDSIINHCGASITHGSLKKSHPVNSGGTLGVSSVLNAHTPLAKRCNYDLLTCNWWFAWCPHLLDPPDEYSKINECQHHLASPSYSQVPIHAARYELLFDFGVTPHNYCVEGSHFIPKTVKKYIPKTKELQVQGVCSWSCYEGSTQRGTPYIIGNAA